MEVGVPGVAPNNVSVGCSGGSMSGSNGKFICKPGSGKELTITVNAKGPDGKSQSMGSYKFRIKTVPTPTIYWGSAANGAKVPAAQVASSPLIPKMLDFEFDVYSTISSFKIAFKKGSNFVEESVNGNQIPGNLQGVIKSLPKGTKVYFDEIKVNKPGGARETLTAVFTMQ
jgi:hypothetical protein